MTPGQDYFRGAGFTTVTLAVTCWPFSMPPTRTRPRWATSRPRWSIVGSGALSLTVSHWRVRRVKGKGTGEGSEGRAVVADSVVVIRIVGSAGEINSACFLFQRTRTGRDAVARVAGMRRKFGPDSFRDVALL